MAEYREDDMTDKIRTSVDVPVPDSLKPDNIEKMLNEKNEAGDFSDEGGKAAGHPRRFGKRFYRRICAGLAAAAVLAVGSVVYLNSKTTPSERDGFVPVENSTLVTAKSYRQLYDLLYQDSEEDGMDGMAYGVPKGEILYETSMSYENSQDVMAENSVEGILDMGAADQTEYSKTNIQEEGVLEADVMITDGQYIYRCSQEKVYIIETDVKTGKMNQVSVINMEETLYNVSMYLEKNQLVIVGEGDLITIAYTYDISDKEHPSLKGSVEAEGYYETSRIVDGYLYFFTTYDRGCMEFSDSSYKEQNSGGYIPLVEDEKLAVSDIYVPCIEQAEGYLVGVSVALDNPAQAADKMAILMYSNEFYVSRKHIYVTEQHYNYQEGDTTDIYKFSYEAGNIAAAGSNNIRGTVHDSFSMDEYNGYLRLVTTERNFQEDSMVVKDGNEEIAIEPGETLNHLYVLDEQLQITGKIENLAPGEQIYSARFMGDTGFFVTYRQTDPLFSVDLSNPSEPVILGELKISGFSEYLHPFGENRLLGIGWETEVIEKTDMTSTVGMKLSMFDTSDMSDVKEISKLVSEEVMSTGLQEDGHRALLVSVEKNLLGMAVMTRVGNRVKTYYDTFQYIEGEGFVKQTETLLETDSYGTDGIRGVYISDILYIGTDTKITAVSLADGAVLHEMKLH